MISDARIRKIAINSDGHCAFFFGIPSDDTNSRESGDVVATTGRSASEPETSRDGEPDASGYVAGVTQAGSERRGYGVHGNGITGDTIGNGAINWYGGPDDQGNGGQGASGSANVAGGIRLYFAGATTGGGGLSNGVPPVNPMTSPVNPTGPYGGDGPGGDVPAPVPEPATMLLLGTGLICLACAGRKKLFKS